MASSDDDKAPPGFPPPHPMSHTGPLPHTPGPISSSDGFVDVARREFARMEASGPGEDRLASEVVKSWAGGVRAGHAPGCAPGCRYVGLPAHPPQCEPRETVGECAPGCSRLVSHRAPEECRAWADLAGQDMGAGLDRAEKPPRVLPVPECCGRSMSNLGVMDRGARAVFACGCGREVSLYVVSYAERAGFRLVGLDRSSQQPDMEIARWTCALCGADCPEARPCAEHPMFPVRTANDAARRVRGEQLLLIQRRLQAPEAFPRQFQQSPPDVQERPFSVKMPEGARPREEMVREVLEVLEAERLAGDSDPAATLRRIIQERNDP